MFLEKKDVKIYYEVQGEGTPLLMVHGAAMDGDWYQGAANILSKYYKVITYDRRGSSRSAAGDDALFDLDTQVGDIKDLLDALEVDTAIIVGASAGAIAAHRFMILYPERVEKVILYEPAVVTLLDNTKHCQRGWIGRIKDMIDRNKLNTAVFEFIQGIGELDKRAPEKSTEATMREMRNLYHFLPKEYETFVEYCPDEEKSKKLADKTIIAVGDGSGEAPFAMAAKALAKMIGKDVLYYPGLHNAPYDLPKEFAICVLGTLMM